MGLGAATVDRVVAMWERWELEPRLDDFGRVNIAQVAGRFFVAAPPALRALLADPPDELDALVALLGDSVEQVVGDARLAYGEARSLHLPEGARVEPVADDDPRFVALARVADRAEWLESSSDEPCELRVGIAEQGELVALAAGQAWYDTIASYGVFTRCDRRGNGLAGEVVAPLIRDTLARDLVPQWRSLFTNVPSCRVADRLGFVTLGHQMVVRVRPS